MECAIRKQINLQKNQYYQIDKISYFKILNNIRFHPLTLKRSILIYKYNQHEHIFILYHLINRACINLWGKLILLWVYIGMTDIHSRP